MGRSCDELPPRERVRLALDHQETDRVPITLVCAELEPPARAALAEHLGVSAGEGVDHYLEQLLDLIPVGPGFRGWEMDYRGPALRRTADGVVEDVWGTQWAPIDYGGGTHTEICHLPLAGVHDVADPPRLRWPDPDWWDYSLLPERIAEVRERRDYALIATSGNPFERTCWMRGMEQTFVDIVEHPELFHEIMSRVTNFYVEATRRTLAAGRGSIDLAFTADDLAGQQALLLSPALWEAHIKPYHVRLAKAIHDFGVKVVYHSDGALMDAIPGLIDAGIDVLQALQFDAAGMDAVAIKQQYGDRLCFQGGISVQRTLPFGTVEEVREEVGERIRVLGRDGGYILSPSHTIMGGTPSENIVAMFETATERPMPRRR
jgi:uroporphyrinogen decarboxylase